MKKPLILLVDDEPAVLAALEAALRPAFEEICRIEAFDDPAQVLEAVPRWTEEKRPIAVAIVDQKMPGMTGVELLVRLRAPVDDPAPAFHPAGHLQAVLLTGYAGLDSALAAKNEAMVERYMEKPWRADDLAKMVRHLLATHLADSGAGRFLVFREARSVEELGNLLRKRYDVYRNSVMKEFCPSNPEGMDLDGWDLRAHHLGLFRCGEETSRPVGYLRVVRDGERPCEGMVLALISQHPSLGARMAVPGDSPFPLLSYCPDADVVRDLYRELRRNGESLVEPGRLSVESHVRTPGLAGFLAESATSVFFFCFDVDHAVLACRPPHRRLYEPLGFRQVPGTEVRFLPHLNFTEMCLLGSKQAIPPAAQGRIGAMAARFRRTRDTCFCPTFPACLPGPYATGDFAATDLFCPLAAKATLAPG